MSFFVGLITGLAVGLALIVGFVRSENARSKLRSELATTIAAFARMTVNDSRKILPAEFYPAWVVFSQRQKLDWLNQHLTKLWPYVDAAASGLIKASVEPVLEQYRPFILSSLKFSKFTLGTVAPQFTGVSIIEDGGSGITMELEMSWDGNPSIILGIKTRFGVSLPVQVKDIGFTGVFRLIFKPLVPEFPCFGAVCYSLRQKKKMDFTLKVIGGDISAIPGLDDAIQMDSNAFEQFDSEQSDFNVHITRKSQRSKNFSPEEDCLLVSAWLNTSKDPITGVDQQTRQFWARVHACFVEHGGNLNNRSQISISNRWQEINREVAKFVGFVTQIENRQQSGTTEESRLNDARQMYASVVGKRFHLEHCWVILKKEPKWQFERASLHQKSNKKQKNHGNASPANSTPSTADSVFLGEDSDTFVYQNRPIGQKAAKEQLRRRQGKEKVGETSVSTRLQQLNETFVDIEDKKDKDRKIMLEQNAVLLKQKQEKQEMEILKMDTSTMNPMVAEYFEEKMMEILARRRSS